MDDIEPSETHAPDRIEPASAFMRAELECSFGPSFFLGHLGRYVRDHCPAANENLPVVQIRLTNGTTLDLCHIIGVSPRWAMLAVRNPAQRDSHDMIIELVPYERIEGVSIRTQRSDGTSIGFTQTRAPEIIAAEALLALAMAPARTDAGHGPTPSTTG